MNERSRTLSNTLFSSVGMYTEYVLGMLTSIIIARHLGPDGFGTYSLVIWLVAMGVATTNSGTASAAIKFVAELRGSGHLEQIPYVLSYLRKAQRVFMLFVLLAGAALFIFAGDHIAPGMNHTLLLGFLIVGVALRSSYMFNIGVAKGFENFRATAIVALVSTPINLLLVIAAWQLDAPVEWLLAVFSLSGIVFYVMSLRQIRPLLPPRQPGVVLPPTLRARISHHMRWTALTVSVSFLVASEVEVMFLNLYADSHDAGQFKVAYQLAVGAAALVPGVFGALLLPMMASALSQGREVAARRFVGTTHYLSLLAVPLMAFGLVFGDDVIHLLYGREYWAAGPLFSACLFATCMTTMAQGASSLLVSADRQRSILVLAATSGVLKLTLAAVLIAHYALVGAVAAYLIVAAVNATLYISLAVKVSHARPAWGALGRVLLAGALAAALAWPLRGHLVPWAAVLLGGVLLVVSYALFTLLLRCWTRDDIGHLQLLHGRFAASRPRAGARLLAWAHDRAGEGIS
ncbi:Membrane protein involved in the export of O-antigen and teichoic acid [Pseudoxanthomonas sp. CF385]|uniref:oligosaccharide flippase family protein n=1 Tax=Pseudoxanthomonas sp. CF385 TaxID=1881042 RepID=UPI00088364FC|nr:oligosaccharide flippase family protein [Pseudoxanthomonas sp. CF385]SDQ88017.1 Membrane protein involved in the export of O-antigen and teichoic acid [Pseudoxanthomonas sp. CF385]